MNISNVERVVIAMVEQREQQENTMENSQLNTIRNTLRKYIIWFDPLFRQNDKTKIEKTLKLLKQHYLRSTLN